MSDPPDVQSVIDYASLVAPARQELSGVRLLHAVRHVLDPSAIEELEQARAIIR